MGVVRNTKLLQLCALKELKILAGKDNRDLGKQGQYLMKNQSIGQITGPIGFTKEGKVKREVLTPK